MTDKLAPAQGAIVRRKPLRESATKQAEHAQVGRRSRREAMTGQAPAGTAARYRRNWVDASLFLQAFREERPLADWANTERAFRIEVTEQALAWLDDHVGDITTVEIQAYENALLNKPMVDKRGNKKVGFERSTINNRLSALRSLFLQAIELGKRTDEPTEKITRKRPDRAYHQPPLPLEQVREVLDAIDRTTPIGYRDWMLIRTIVRMGLRREEAAEMTVGDFDRAPDGGLQVTLRRKGDKRQIVLVPRDLERALSEYMATLDLDDVLFPVIRGAGKVHRALPLSTSSVTKIVRKRVSAALGRPVGPHALRATSITEALDAGAPLPSVQRYHGHRDVQTTLLYHGDKLDRSTSAGDLWDLGEGEEDPGA